MAERSKKTLARGKYLELVREGHWEYAHRVRGIGATAIIAVTSDQQLILTEQYRIPLGRRVIDLPAGLVGDLHGEENEDFELSAKRELLEETGYQARRLKFLFAGPTSPGMTTEIVHFYLAREARKVGDGGGDDAEDIQVHLVPLEKAYRWLKRRARTQVLIDPKTIMALAVLDRER